MLKRPYPFLMSNFKYRRGYIFEKGKIHLLKVTCLTIFLTTNIALLNAGEAPPSPNATTTKLHINFSFKGANPTYMQSDFHTIEKDKMIETCIVNANELPLLNLFIKDNPSLQKNISQLTYSLEKSKEREHVLLKFTSEYLSDSIQFEKIYKISKRSHTFRYVLKILGKNADTFVQDNNLGIVMRHGEGFIPPHSAGFSGNNDKVKAIVITSKRVHKIDPKKASVDTLRSTSWIGFRNNFWALLCRPITSDVLIDHRSTTEKNELFLTFKPGQKECSFQLFAGPLEYKTLNNKNTNLSVLLFSNQWFWMRWICLGLLILLNWLTTIITNHGLAIIMLSVCVKILMYPLVRIADKWQRRVNVQKSTLQPLIDEIKRNTQGEEQNKRILQIYKEQEIHPLYTLKSLLSVLIQIPIFFAAYHMLDENIALSGVSFLWINDLALPDNLIRLPFTIPFFGEYLNLLPFVMTGITILTSWKFKDSSLSPKLLRKQQQSLYWMALLFFILFYTFPAGMVLYWTTNNLTAFVKVLLKNLDDKQVPENSD